MSLPKRKIGSMLLTLVLLLLPTQLAFHFWPSFSLIHGLPIDTLAPAIYSTDIAILLLLFFSKDKIGALYPKLSFLGLILLNVLFSVSPLLSVYRWLKILEYLLFARLLFKKHPSNNSTISTCLSLGTAVVVVLAWIQFFLQSSLGGPGYLLGERTFNTTTPGIAHTFVNSQLLLRAYSTFSHPNSLAGYLLVAGTLLVVLNKKMTPTSLMAFITILITFSRTALVSGVILIFLTVKKSKPIVNLLVFALLIYTLFITNSPISITSRIDQLKDWGSLFVARPLGVGLGAYQVAVQKSIPVHNSVLLLVGELGLPFTCYLLYFGRNYLKHITLDSFFPVLGILLTSFGDHYWLTLPQNSLLMFVVVGYWVSDVKSHHENLL